MYAPFQIIAVRGNATSNLYAYNFGLNTWTTLAVFMGQETFNTGAATAMLHGRRKMLFVKENSVRAYQLDLTTGVLEPFATLPYVNPVVLDGKRARMVRTPDGAAYLYIIRAGSQEMFRVALEWL
jgi:hypothetical protein